jgi:hypothetical protein
MSRVSVDTTYLTGIALPRTAADTDNRSDVLALPRTANPAHPTAELNKSSAPA